VRPITEIAEELGFSGEKVKSYGKWKAKIGLVEVANLTSGKRNGKLILVTAMTPTPFGEGKTVTSIGLAMALRRLGRSSILCIRQPSMGPVFGIKGGAAGGGKATVEPMQDINMGFTGDIDAVTAAHNLLSAMLDNHIFHGNDLRIDPRRIKWPRTMDMNDRALRRIVVGLGVKGDSVGRNDNFVITAASEVMAILCLSKSYADLKERLGNIILGYTGSGGPVRAADLRAVGSMAALLKNAMEPNLVQTVEGTPALIHGGPFGNIAHGTSSVVSISLGLKLCDYCVVEAGFASELGAEKFVDIVTRTGGFSVNAAVVVASVKALRYHGGAAKEALQSINLKAVQSGLENLGKHIENVRLLNLSPVVAINRFPDDSDEEISLVKDFCNGQNVPWAVSTVFAEGGKGGEELAQRVLESIEVGTTSEPIYSLEQKIEEKLWTIVTKLYGGTGVEYERSAEEDLRHIEELGCSNQPICVAKTPLSLSDDPAKIGRPRDFKVRVRNLSVSAGARFNVVYMGDIVTMPGLPRKPAAERINLTDDGEITGLY
jgi:formate--tetrahydrofolate ligase